MKVDQYINEVIKKSRVHNYGQLRNYGDSLLNTLNPTTFPTTPTL